jgi:HAD superfamily hydrolase (TIGR01484 family)
MQSLAQFPAAARRAVAFVFTDIDDTLTREGRLSPAAFAGMAALEGAGIKVIPVTGRPAGWCDHIARMWPVDAVVGENGAFYFRYDADARRMQRRYWLDAAARRTARERLTALGERILAAVPGSAIAADQAYREADLAIDHCEDVAPLPRAAVDEIVALCRAAGAEAKVSSIHVNAWFGDFDKLAMSQRLLREVYALDPEVAEPQCTFVGDSPNDAPMFGYFRHAVGVSNVRAFLDRMDALPAYVTDGPGGVGFAELADALLAAR